MATSTIGKVESVSLTQCFIIPKNLAGTISKTMVFTVTRQLGKVQLVATYMGYQAQNVELDLQKDTTVDISLQIKSDELQEVTSWKTK
jgi:hypothetical protein